MVRTILPWSGLLITLLVSSLVTCTPGTAPRERNYVFSRLDQSRSYSQTFVVEQGDLAAIRVLLFPPREVHDDLVILRVHYPGENLPDLVHITVPVQSLSAHGMTTFAFEALRLPAPRDGSNLVLQFTIDAPTLPVGKGITVIGGPDTYTEGRFYVNGKAVDEADLAFQPVYRVRWLDQIFPISRIAYGKPGMLGWPPLYALLMYGYLYLLLRGLMRWWVKHRA